MADESNSFWKAELSDAEAVWEQCSEKETFYPTRLISLMRQRGSQHDGDRQFQTARLLAVVSQDPYDALLHFTHSPDPYDRAFAISVIEALGDRRFVPRLTEMYKDDSPLKEWDVLLYRTVGQAAAQAVTNMDGHKFTDEENFPAAEWIRLARKKPE